jgi:hypothetical protein
MVSSQNASTNSKNRLGLPRIYCLTSNFPCAISFAGKRREMINMKGELEKRRKPAVFLTMRECYLFSSLNFKPAQVNFPHSKLFLLP